MDRGRRKMDRAQMLELRLAFLGHGNQGKALLWYPA